MDENTIKSKLDNTWEKIQKKIETENITDKIERVECAFNLVYDDISEEYNKKYTLTNDEKKTISNMVVFYSLRIWIDNDKKSRQSIVSFAKQPYILKRLFGEEITVRPNIRVRKFLEDYLSELTHELKRLEIINSNTDVLDNIKYIVELIYKMTM